jgi:hypothetical protein
MDKKRKTRMDMSDNNPNKGKPVYFKDELHYIVFEMSDNILISKNKDLSKVFCVKRKNISFKPKKK